MRLVTIRPGPTRTRALVAEQCATGRSGGLPAEDSALRRERWFQLVTFALLLAHGCAWAELELTLTSGGRVTTVCTARVTIPASEGDNPWKRRGEDWKPRASA